MKTLQLLEAPTQFLLFTGKGGVGKTSLSAATALALADSGKSVLLVSTDAASNLDEILGVALRNEPTPVPGAPLLSVLNIDPSSAAESYRQRVLAQLSDAPAKERETVREQLSGACTTEIAAFDEFSALLASEPKYQHVVFDTAPTGHTLRLLSLPRAWSGFLGGNDRGASCLGPHSGLKMKETRFNAALSALTSADRTTVVLVTLPDRGAIAEAARTAAELSDLGMKNQRLAINGVFHATDRSDAVALAVERTGQDALGHLPPALAELPREELPLRAWEMVGLPALRGLIDGTPPPGVVGATKAAPERSTQPLAALVDQLAARDHGLVMVMGKGGVGKTTLAAALAVALVQRGHAVHLTTTDPAAHVATTLAGELPGLRLSRIDPRVETQHYIDRVMDSRGAKLDAQGKALLLEDLRSPCTEEVAVFSAFSRLIAEAKTGFVVLDTAPTGHSLLLLDATGAYHRQTLHTVQSTAEHPLRVVTPLMRLQNPELAQVVLVTLPEATPVSQAAALQEDLRRAKIEPFAWVVNRSLAAAHPSDPLLAARVAHEVRQFDRIAGGLAKQVFVVPLQLAPPIGVTALTQLASRPEFRTSVAQEPTDGALR